MFKKIAVLALPVLISLYIGAVIGYELKDREYTQPVSPTYQQSYKQHPEMLELAEKLGIDVTHVNLTWVDVIENANTDSAKAAFMPPNEIQLTPELEDPLLGMAHEYIHYKFYLMSQQERDKLVNEASSWPVDGWIESRLASYKDCDSTCKANETIAYLCTERDPRDLNSDFTEYCNSLVPNRSILFE